MITINDVTIEQATSDWGGPLIRISLPNRLIESTSWRPDETRVFTLRHTRGLEGMKGRDSGHGWHVDDGLSGWHGVLGNRDADDTVGAINEMIEYLNFLAERDKVREAMEGYLSDISETLAGFTQSLEFRSRRDHTEEWPQFVAAVAAADAVYRATRGGAQ